MGENADNQPFFSNLFGPSQPKPKKGILHKAEVAVGLKEEDPSAFDIVCDACGCDKLPWKYRIGGFAGCAFLGFVLSIGSTIRLESLIAGNPDPFVILFTFGTIISLIGSMFLSTPKKYFKKACDKYHWGATTTFVTSIVLTLFCVYYTEMPDGGRVGIIVLAILFQYLAYFWFTLSMIPFVARIQQDFCRNKCRTCMYSAFPCCKTSPSGGIFG